MDPPESRPNSPAGIGVSDMDRESDHENKSVNANGQRTGGVRPDKKKAARHRAAF
jgi:hypothetical protein